MNKVVRYAIILPNIEGEDMKKLALKLASEYNATVIRIEEVGL